MPRQPKILILDSGAGALSVAQEIAKLHPHADITCFADFALYPYGKIAEDALIARQVSLIAHLKNKVQPDIVVVACNTASTAALEALRAQFDLPFIGVVPAIKPAAKLTQSGAIGILATPATVKRPYTAQLLNSFAQGLEVEMHGSIKLVELAEALLSNQKVENKVLEEEVQQILGKTVNPIDTVVLACTHFPLLKQRLASIEQFSHIQWVDSGSAIAMRVSYWLEKLALATEGPEFTSFTIRYTESTAERVFPKDAYCSFIAENFSNKPLENINVYLEKI